MSSEYSKGRDFCFVNSSNLMSDIMIRNRIDDVRDVDNEFLWRVSVLVRSKLHLDILRDKEHKKDIDGAANQL